MSDSDELEPSNVFAYQNESTMVSGSGPGINFSHTGPSFRSNMMSSTRMPPIFERPRYAESSYDQRSLYRRETSPMSVRSVCDERQMKFNYSFNPHRSSARSVYNGRAGSSMSVRSIDSTASTSAVDIANALKNEHFSKHDLKVIKEAYNKFVRHRVRKKIDKRRYRKVRRRRSGEDSGEQGSDSSISSEDGSTRTGNYKDNMSSGRSAITDISTFRRTIQNNNMFKDCTDNFKHYSGQRNNASVNLNNTQMSMKSTKSIFPASNMPVFKKPANIRNLQSKAPVTLQKERFTNGFLLPSQRFNKSGDTTAIPENVNKTHNNKGQNNLPPIMNKNSERQIDTDSEGNNIFSAAQKPNEYNQKTIFSAAQNPSKKSQRKRSIDEDGDDDVYFPNQKRQKPLSPCKNKKDSQSRKATTNTDDNADDFIFAKPTLPVQKLVKEKLISKSAAPSLDTLLEAPANMEPIPVQIIENDKEQEEEPSNATQNSTNMSMRPSFMKRKLFTQQLDVSEKKNLSTDNINSPQNSMYHLIQKERKARKLQQATTQSCLNRDLQKDDNNLLDLIQKIVPMDKMNVTNQTNKTDMQSKNLTEENTEKWDVTDIISTHKNDSDVSDTFTDEEILNSTVKELQKKEVAKNFALEKESLAQKNNLLKEKFTKDNALKNKEKVVKEIRKELTVAREAPVKNKKKNAEEKQLTVQEDVFKKPSPIKTNNCRILLDTLPANLNMEPIKQFWDTDFESDAECTLPSKNKKTNLKENLSSRITDKQQKETPQKQGLFSVFNLKKPGNSSNATFQNFTFDNTQKFNASTLRIKSHRAPKRNKFDKTVNQDKLLTIREPEFTLQKAISPPKLITEKNKRPQKETSTKINTKSPNRKKQIPKENIVSTQKSKARRPRKIDDDENVTQNEKETNNNVSRTPKNKKLTETKNNRQTKKDTKVDRIETKKVEPKAPKTKQSETKKPEKVITRNNSTLTKETRNRSIRSCQLNNSNISTKKLNDTLDTTSNRTLRSRNVDQSITSNAQKTKNTQKSSNKTEVKNRLSDVSFSFQVNKNAVAKRAVKKNTNYFKADESDISFSLKDFAPSSPRITRSRSNITINKNNTRESMFLRNSHIKDTFESKNKSFRNRVPTKRYLC